MHHPLYLAYQIDLINRKIIDKEYVIMNVIIFVGDKLLAENLKSEIMAMGHSIVLCTDNLNKLKSHVTASDFVEVYLIEIINENTIGVNAFNLVRKVQRQNLSILITENLDYIIYDSIIKIYAFNCIYKQNLGVELSITLELAEEEIKGKNLLIYSSKYQKISLSISGIYYLETKNGVVYINHENGIFLIRAKMDYILRNLNDDFIQCHRSFAVNKRKFLMVDFKNKQLILKNGLQCPYTKHWVKKWLFLI